MTAEERAELRRLAEAATPGPWKVEEYEEWDDSGRRLCWYVDMPGNEDSTVLLEMDAAFIAAARTAVPALLDEVDQLRAEATQQRVDVLFHVKLAERHPDHPWLHTRAAQDLAALQAENERLRAVIAGIPADVFINRTSGMLDFCRCCRAKESYPGAGVICRAYCAAEAARKLQREVPSNDHEASP